MSKNYREKASQGLAVWLSTNCQELGEKDSWLYKEPDFGSAAKQPAWLGLKFQKR